MNIPSFGNYKWVSSDGSLSDSAWMFEDELNRAMQGALSDNGWTIPQLLQSEIIAISPSMADGTVWYSTDDDELVVKVNGVLRKVTTTAYP